jgi:addiction module HigA family antidote
MKSTKTFQFILNLKNIDQSTPHLEDRLYDANCDDALIHFRNGAVYLDFDREAASLEEAIISAMKDVKSAFMDAEISSVSPSDLVTEAEIAKRLNKTRQTVSLWIKGERRKSFPQPIMRLTEKSLLWSWSEVTNWLHENGIIKDIKLVESARLIANINAVLKECDQPTREFRQKLMSKMGLYNLNYHESNRMGRLMEPKKDYELKKQPPAHPGQMLLKEFLEPAGITQQQFADHLGWTYARLSEIINGHQAVNAESALTFADALKIEPEFWLNLQRDWDLWHANMKHKKIKGI